ncbi:MAG TPA: choice-of-anchor L domain-containing protein [Nannocystaceae bacterium]|nr:choice-of-anchor L domain-containing protein [Nannocystaceae bacterium]
MSIVVAAGCEVHGLVGSNASAGGDGGDDVVGETSIGVADDDGGTTQSGVDGADESHEETGGEDTTGPRFDVGLPDAPAGCNLPDRWPSCDSLDDNPFHAMGFNCGDTGPRLDVGEYEGYPGTMTVHSGRLGTYPGPPPGNGFAPREGEKFVVLSTGDATELAMSRLELRNKYSSVDGHPCQNADQANGGCPSSVMMDIDGTLPDDQPLYTLPDPIDVRPSDGDCGENPEFVGSGDCSNSLMQEWLKGGRAYDYGQLRMTTTVPSGVDGFTFDFAFFSVEYPLYPDHESLFNDMFVVWLDSESWTGNVSFDSSGHVISVNSVLFDYRAPSETCPNCQAPQLQGFAADGHGGTEWLTTTAPVRPDEQMTLVFALFDMGDATFDSMAILDHFEWTCSGVPPFTTPAG